MSVTQLFVSLMLLALILLLSNILVVKFAWLRNFFIPGSIVGGVILLLLGPYVLGVFVKSPFADGGGLFPSYVLDAWADLPGLLINVVFAALFIGKPIPGIRDIWYRAGPQVVVGQTMAWGQYVLGLSLAILVLVPMFDMNPIVGALIEIGFEGGHGTAAGMAGTFSDLGFEAGADLALGMATIGIVSGVLVGTLMVNIAARRGVINPGDTTNSAQRAKQEGPSDAEQEDFHIELAQEKGTTDPLSLHLGLVGVAILLGWLLLSGFQWLESVTWARDGGLEIMAHVPLFPLAMIGGVMVQLLLARCGWERHVSQRLMSRISGTALDFTIVSALATLALTTLGDYLLPFLMLAALGILWPVLVLVFLAPRVMPDHWFERGISDLGQSMGVTVTGLLLLRMADPKNDSGAMETFGYKQLLFEPVVGGGLFTAAAPPLIAQFGPGPVLILTAGLTVVWIAFGLLYFGRRVPGRGQGRWSPKQA